MNGGVAGKSSSSVITWEIELGGRFFLSPSLDQHSQNKQGGFFLPFLFSQVGENYRIHLFLHQFLLFYTQMSLQHI